MKNGLVELVKRLTELRDLTDSGPWFKSEPYYDGFERLSVDIGPYDLSERPNKDLFYEDTIATFFNDNTVSADHNAELVVLLVSNLDLILEGLKNLDPEYTSIKKEKLEEFKKLFDNITRMG